MLINYIDYLFVSTNNYNFKTWQEFFPDGKVNIQSLCFNSSWNTFFDNIKDKTYFKKIEETLEKYILNGKTILPYPELLFSPLNILSPHMIKTMFIGQDPYININKYGKLNIPQACGHSFSVPYGYKFPPSLRNIFNNAIHHKHISESCNNGCLLGWILQGCFMINSSFTTFEKISNAHASLWAPFTKDLLQFINSNCNNIPILSWGANSHRLCSLFDHDKHHVIYSSHPSSYSYMVPVNGFVNNKKVIHPPFNNVDHLGEVNKYLKSVDKSTILWNIIEN